MHRRCSVLHVAPRWQRSAAPSSSKICQQTQIRVRGSHVDSCRGSGGVAALRPRRCTAPW